MSKLPIIQILPVLLLTGCLGSNQVNTPTAINSQPTFTSTLILIPAFTATPPPTGTATQPSVTREPEGCLKPVDDYTRVEVNGQTLNQRTLFMLVTAQKIYGEEIEISGYAITQEVIRTACLHRLGHMPAAQLTFQCCDAGHTLSYGTMWNRLSTLCVWQGSRRGCGNMESCIRTPLFTSMPLPLVTTNYQMRRRNS